MACVIISNSIDFSIIYPADFRSEYFQWLLVWFLGSSQLKCRTILVSFMRQHQIDEFWPIFRIFCSKFERIVFKKMPKSSIVKMVHQFSLVDVERYKQKLTIFSMKPSKWNACQFRQKKFREIISRPFEYNIHVTFPHPKLRSNN